MRQFVCAVLRTHGYRVLEAEDGEAALAARRSHAGAVHLAVLDMLMPRRSGRSAFEALRQYDPHLRYLFTTGYAGGQADEEFAQRVGVHLLRKPYSADDLLRAVRDVMD